MFLFEKSLIGAYCNRLYDLKERQGPFSCKGRIKVGLPYFRCPKRGKVSSASKIQVGQDHPLGYIQQTLRQKNGQ